MTKKELIKKIEKYPDDIKIIVWDMMNGNCELEHVEVFEEVSYFEKPKKVIKLW